MDAGIVVVVDMTNGERLLCRCLPPVAALFTNASSSPVHRWDTPTYHLCSSLPPSSIAHSLPHSALPLAILPDTFRRVTRHSLSPSLC